MYVAAVETPPVCVHPVVQLPPTAHAVQARGVVVVIDCDTEVPKTLAEPGE